MTVSPYKIPNPDALRMVNSASNAMASMAMIKARQHNPSIDIANAIIEELQSFQNSLNDTEDMVVSISTIGPSTKVTNVSRSGAHLLIFDGEQESGLRTRSVIHCSQLAMTMSAEPKQQPDARRIGFHTA